MKNIFKHISRSYFDLYNALKQAYKNYPDWLFIEIAGAFDFISELMNRIASDILYPKTRESAYGFASRCDYEPTEADGCTTDLDITLASVMNKTLAVGYQFGGVNSSGNMVIFEVITATSVVAASSMVVPVKQQKTKSSLNIGTILNADDWLELEIKGFTGVIKSSISLTSSDGTWTRVDNFDNSILTDLHFVLLYQSGGKSRVQFGNGVTGVKPTINSVVSATFATTLGLLGQMEIGEINLNTGEDPDITEVTNADETIGGNNSESVASIIRNARANVRLRDIVWTQEDLETTARQSSSSVQKAFGIPGLGTAIIQVIPAGGGNPSAPLKAIVEAYVQSKSQFGIMPLTASDPTYVPVNITATITVRTGFVLAKCQDLAEFALTLVSSAFDNQVTEYFTDNGIDKTRTDVINTVWAWAFVEADNDALAFIIQTWINLLGDRDYRDWDQDLEVGNLWQMGDSLYDYGIDVFNLTAPTTNQVATSLQIINTGTVTVT